MFLLLNLRFVECGDTSPHSTNRKSKIKNGLTGAAQVFLVLPVATAAGLSRHDQIEARHEGDELAAASRLLPGVDRDAGAAAAAFAGETCRQFPSVREYLGVDLETHLGTCHGMRGPGRF